MAPSYPLCPLHLMFLGIKPVLSGLMIKIKVAQVKYNKIALETHSLNDYFLVYSQRSSHFSIF